LADAGAPGSPVPAEAPVAEVAGDGIPSLDAPPEALPESESDKPEPAVGDGMAEDGPGSEAKSPVAALELPVAQILENAVDELLSSGSARPELAEAPDEPPLEPPEDNATEAQEVAAEAAEQMAET
jgi:hypothetical protein